jgi:uncharacterized membrane protein
VAYSNAWLIWHALPAAAAVIVGAGVLLAAKGTARHKGVGRLWVGLMLWVAASSFVLADHFSWIHLLSGWTLLSLTLAIIAIRRGHRRAHQRHMLGCAGGLLIAGALAVLTPGRLTAGLFGL